ncbi:MAG: hypothetical protein FJY56_08535 [Betaproteobacteria bacterium]|nr:hypothetical protein [Betaproteobacteria bacterium]
MIVPRYWAEARLRERTKKRQVTVQRFGWSDVSEAEAQAHAEARAREALAQILAGKNLLSREPKVPYNGAEGVPIREEIVSEHENTVVTRNGYGARCLNTPNVLFVDIDFDNATAADGRHVLIAMAASLVAALAVGWVMKLGLLTFVLSVLALLIPVAVATLVRKARVRAAGGAEALARKRINAYLAANPQAHLRLYRTPAGLRVLAMHKTFDPRESAVAECFKALGADPVYARMCVNQNCFRARVSAKPWRIGVGQHMRPRPGTWPVKPERLAVRRQWIEAYEKAAQGFAACRYVELLGPQAGTMATRGVQALHDELCRANSDLPMA